MSQQNWRTETDGYDYLLHQRKQLQVADRRPVIRRAADLVGPGIGATATKITDFNNLLATYNGFYSAEPGAANSPDENQAFVGITVMDSTLGGYQMFRSLASGLIYERTFLRNPTDAATIYWGDWATSGASAVYSYAAKNTDASIGPSSWTGITGWTDTSRSGVDRTGGVWSVNAPGVYYIAIKAGFDPNSTGSRAVRIMVNTSVELDRDRRQALTPGGAVTQIKAFGEMSLNAGHTIEFQVWQDSGASLTLRSSLTSVTIRRLF